MALAAANSPRYQASMASLANESEMNIGGGTMVGRSEGEVGPAAMELGLKVTGANGDVLGPNGRKRKKRLKKKKMKKKV